MFVCSINFFFKKNTDVAKRILLECVVVKVVDLMVDLIKIPEKKKCWQNITELCGYSWILWYSGASRGRHQSANKLQSFSIHQKIIKTIKKVSFIAFFVRSNANQYRMTNGCDQKHF